MHITVDFRPDKVNATGIHADDKLPDMLTSGFN